MSAPPSPTRWAARQPEGLLGIYLNFLLARLLGGSPQAESEQERAALDALAHSGRVTVLPHRPGHASAGYRLTPCWIHPPP